MQKNPFVSIVKITVRYQETDQMGIAHHSVYPVWFEAGRTELMREQGFPYSRMEAEGFYLPLIELGCTFKGPARYEDRLLIRAWVAQATNTRIRFDYKAVKEEGGRMLAFGVTSHVFADAALKPVNLKKYRPELLTLLQSIQTEGADGE
jgi:acyl-CoA thioester hydrolase